jgi:hypothetical protein
MDDKLQKNPGTRRESNPYIPDFQAVAYLYNDWATWLILFFTVLIPVSSISIGMETNTIHCQNLLTLYVITSTITEHDTVNIDFLRPSQPLQATCLFH